MSTEPVTYRDAGVDIEEADALVEKIKDKVKSTCGDRVVSGVGGFACLYDIGHDKLLAAGTDGVGTKLKIAQMLGRHDSIGIDLVAMCVNDILCTGARPLFFMDYFATGKLDSGVAASVIDGVVEGCTQSGAALIGGETAEMPGMYADGEYDLAGFAVGEVMRDDVIDGARIAEGDTLIGLLSSGCHSNGYSLVRKLIGGDDTALLERCLEPTRIYWNAVDAVLSHDRGLVSGMAHVTGGGLLNVARMNGGFDYVIDAVPEGDMLPEIFGVLRERSKLDAGELYRTFNMGIGFVIATPAPGEVETLLDAAGYGHMRAGSVQNGSGEVVLKLEGAEIKL